MASDTSAPDFSLFSGGPFFQLLHRAHLASGSEVQLPRPVAVITLIAWLPLLLLSAIEHHLDTGSVALPFLPDVEAHIRFLAALPLLLLAEVLADRRMRPILRLFLERGMIPEGARGELAAAGARAVRVRDSGFELLLIPFVYGVGILFVWRGYLAIDTASWYRAPSTTGAGLTLAGMWYGFVSLPIFQFLLCRWYLRLAIWARFLWEVSRIKLNLMPTHPDRMGGLGFLPAAVRPFALLTMAHGALVAGYIGNQVLFVKVAPTEFKAEVILLVAMLLIATLGALLVFVPILLLTKRRGLEDYSKLAVRYVRGFDAKWMRGSRASERLLGNPDLQSLADLANSYSIVSSIRLAPISKEVVALMVAGTLLPLAPLLLALIPLETLLTKLLGMVF